MPSIPKLQRNVELQLAFNINNNSHNNLMKNLSSSTTTANVISTPTTPSSAAISTSVLQPMRFINTNGSSPGISSMSAAEMETRAIWRMADAVCFDVDSTVCEDEAIDELASFCGKEKEVSQITKNAMSGKMDFRAALRTRLNIIQPTFQELHAYIQSSSPKLTPGIRELIAALHRRKVPVYLVSGGFHSIICDVAQELDIPYENIYANRLKFYYDGQYAGFDEDAPVSRTAGKAEVVKLLKEMHGYCNLVTIGDGATDLHTCPPADAFIGFGGNKVRDEVRRHANWFVTDFKVLLDELNRMPASGKLA